MLSNETAHYQENRSSLVSNTSTEEKILAGIVFFGNGEFYAAKKNLEIALILADEVNRTDIRWELLLTEARGWLGVSTVIVAWLEQQGREEIDKGGKLIDEAIESAERLGDTKLLAELLNGKSAYFGITNQKEEEEAVLRIAAEMHKRSGSREGLVLVYSHLFENLSARGYLGEGRSILYEALAVVSPTDDPQDVASLYTKLGKAALLVGEFQEAARYYRRAREMFSEYAEQDKVAGDSSYWIAVCNRHLGTIHRLIGDLENAVNYHLLSERFFSREQSYQSERAIAYVDLGLDYLEQGLVLAANDYATRAMALLSGQGDQQVHVKYQDEVKIWLLNAKIASAQSDNTRLQQAASQLELLFSKGTALPSKQLSYFELLMHHHYSRDEISLAQLYGERALAQIQSVQSQLVNKDGGAEWVNKTRSVIDLYLAVLFDAHRRSDGQGTSLSKLFSVMEQTNAINLRLQRKLAKQVDARASAERNQKVTEAWLTLLEKERQLINATNATERNSVSLALDTAKEHYSALIYREYQTASDTRLAALSLRSIQRRLGPSEILLQYQLGPDSGFVLAVTRKHADAVSIPNAELLGQQVQKVLGAIDYNKLSERSYTTLLSELYQNLFPGEILTWMANRNLLIVASGPLQLLPFPALNQQANNGLYQPLVTDRSVVRIISASEYLRSLNRREADSPPSITVFADPAFSVKEIGQRQISGQSENSFRSWSKGLERLPWTAEEAKAIKQQFPELNVTLHLGRAATNTALMSQASRHSDILHIASHGYFNDVTPTVVGIATASVDQQGTEAPGFISLSELLSQPFYSQLVVISGCETFKGRELKGEGLESLSYGLIQQGAGSVIATLWPIPDKPTADFMKRFYTNLKQLDGEISQALHQTKREFAAAGPYRHPFFWGGFVLTAFDRQSLRLLDLDAGSH